MSHNHICVFGFYSIAAIIQAQIFDDVSATNKDVYPQFNIMPNLPPELGGHINASQVPKSVLIQETINDSRLREKIIEGSVPTVDTIFRCLFVFSTKNIATHLYLYIVSSILYAQVYQPHLRSGKVFTRVQHHYHHLRQSLNFHSKDSSHNEKLERHLDWVSSAGTESLG